MIFIRYTKPLLTTCVALTICFAQSLVMASEVEVTCQLNQNRSRIVRFPSNKWLSSDEIRQRIAAENFYCQCESNKWFVMNIYNVSIQDTRLGKTTRQGQYHYYKNEKSYFVVKGQQKHVSIETDTRFLFTADFSTTPNEFYIFLSGQKNHMCPPTSSQLPPPHNPSYHSVGSGSTTSSTSIPTLFSEPSAPTLSVSSSSCSSNTTSTSSGTTTLPTTETLIKLLHNINNNKLKIAMAASLGYLAYLNSAMLRNNPWIPVIHGALCGYFTTQLYNQASTTATLQPQLRNLLGFSFLGGGPALYGASSYLARAINDQFLSRHCYNANLFSI